MTEVYKIMQKQRKQVLCAAGVAAAKTPKGFPRVVCRSKACLWKDSMDLGCPCIALPSSRSERAKAHTPSSTWVSRKGPLLLCSLLLFELTGVSPQGHACSGNADDMLQPGAQKATSRLHLSGTSLTKAGQVWKKALPGLASFDKQPQVPGSLLEMRGKTADFRRTSAAGTKRPGQQGIRQASPRSGNRDL